MIFIFIVALSDAKTKVENMKVAVNVLEDEKRIQAQGKFYNIFDNDYLCKFQYFFTLYLFSCYTIAFKLKIYHLSF